MKVSIIPLLMSINVSISWNAKISIKTSYLQKQSAISFPDLEKLLIAKTSIIFMQMLNRGKSNTDGASQISLLGKAKKQSNGTYGLRKYGPLHNVANCFSAPQMKC